MSHLFIAVVFVVVMVTSPLMNAFIWAFVPDRERSEGSLIFNNCEILQPFSVDLPKDAVSYTFSVFNITLTLSKTKLSKDLKLACLKSQVSTVPVTPLFTVRGHVIKLKHCTL